ncbi:Glycosyltransferase involved in cell wall bisynthesis [Desulfovibrio litoralis DSM 11393]|uniref:Glycosyltransferase involved in cell wall bisynthesis n=2 Tax=Desulfovibrio litoralis TaxID=466107 RepID=A0A1M7SCD5_9BACT|nr:Glycosyltransferase involved in cell wall bisynthesis [Desulfovibrio litoralis DSM 11393]
MNANPDLSGEKKLKIIQVVNVRWFNATAWYALFLSKLLKEAGHDVLVIGLKDTDSFRQAEKFGLKPISLDLNSSNPFKIFSTFFRLKKLIQTFQPDVINCHRGEGFVLFGLLKKILNSFVLIRTRGDQRLPKNNWINRILHVRVSDAVIATNQYMATHFLKEIKVSPENLYTIFGGVDNSKFYPALEYREEIRRRLGYKNSDFVLGLLGRFDLVKGQKELIKAVSLLHKKGLKQVKLLLLGFSTTLKEEEVRAWIKEEALEESVIITGKVDKINEYLQALDLGVVPSLWSETIARAALELMSVGIPTIGTTVGVMPDIFPHSALIPPNNIEKLAELIQKSMENKQFLTQIKEAEEIIIKKLSMESFLNTTLIIYYKALDNLHAKH